LPWSECVGNQASSGAVSAHSPSSLQVLLNACGCRLVGACCRTYLTHRKIIRMITPASMQAKTLMIVARTSGGAVKESPTLSIHNFSLENSGLPGSAMNPWTIGAWSGVVMRSVMIVMQPVAKMMNSKARMVENLDILVDMVLGER
jgi:hypothetical protein